MYSRYITEDSEDNIYSSSTGYLNIVGTGGDKSFLIKLTPNGCYTNECKPVVNLGDYHKPNNLITERNEIHIYNKDTGQSYRYTFSPRNRDVWEGGKLLKSTSMSGEGTWEETGREIRGSGYQNGNKVTTFIRENFDFNQEIPEIQSDWHYNFGYNVGDILELEHTFTNQVDLLEVINIEDITLLDGRTKKQFTLECQNLDSDGNPYPQRIWIEDIGDINDFLNTPFACLNPGNEVITCFISDGELIWQHPDYNVCTVSTEASTTSLHNFFPNPADDYIQLDFKLKNYSILDIFGGTVMSGKKIDIGESINLSTLKSGSYLLIGEGKFKNYIAERFVKY